VIFADDFLRTSPSDLGPRWDILSGAWRTNSKANSDLDALDRALAAGVTCADCRIDARMVNFAGGESMLELRVNGDNRYALALTPSGALEIRRYAGPSYALLATVASGIVDLGTWHAFAFTATGTFPTTLTAEIDGVSRLSVTDASASAYIGSGRAGIAATVSGILFQPFKLTSLR